MDGTPVEASRAVNFANNLISLLKEKNHQAPRQTYLASDYISPTLIHIQKVLENNMFWLTNKVVMQELFDEIFLFLDNNISNRELTRQKQRLEQFESYIKLLEDEDKRKQNIDKLNKFLKKISRK